MAENGQMIDCPCICFKAKAPSLLHKRTSWARLLDSFTLFGPFVSFSFPFPLHFDLASDIIGFLCILQMLERVFAQLGVISILFLLPFPLLSAIIRWHNLHDPPLSSAVRSHISFLYCMLFQLRSSGNSRFPHFFFFLLI